MPAFLCYHSSEGEQRVLCESVVTIGRDKTNRIVLRSKSVSRRHAIVQRLGEADYYLVDVGSSNGSFVNDQRISVPFHIKDGDELQIGETQIRFEQEESTGVLDSMEDDTERTTLVQSTRIQQITILVADIRGYTQLSEMVPIGDMTRLMSEWFHEVNAAVARNGGLVDKFIGDCVYARWQAGDDLTASVRKVLSAGLAIRDCTSRISSAADFLPAPLRIGIGINTGHAAVGIGIDNTALGDAVNLAFRLETASKDLGVDVVVSESSFSALPEEFWSRHRDDITVKGKSEPVKVAAFSFAELEERLESSHTLSEAPPA
ncbi:MAG: adenylate/guanylate cyclase domain-containing protein [Gammaproteobacteria bacterium]|jgi:adenylate cyclase|nr:adenylate/guanylate cyclase domain-containing protein [Gammaproteobacteria bacterium]